MSFAAAVSGFSFDPSYTAAMLQTPGGNRHHSNNNNIKGGVSSCRSPYQATDDSDDDGASDYAESSRRLRPLRRGRDNTTRHDEHDEPDNLLQRFYETTVDAPCRQVACQGSIEEQLDLLTVRK